MEVISVLIFAALAYIMGAGVSAGIVGGYYISRMTTEELEEIQKRSPDDYKEVRVKK